MSADHLPEDLRHWPRDPYQILGVAPRCDPLEARRAYTGLIRHFKPEQFPEHFRLIREAFETVKRERQFFGGTNADAAANGSGQNPDAAQPGAPQTGGVDLLQILWDKACNGQEEEAYVGLRQMYEINPLSSDLAARLYALLLTNPELDPQRVPCDWLARGVRDEGPWGPCRQLYRREIDDHPNEALSDRFAALLEGQTLPRNVVDLLAWRWEALQRLGRTDHISADLRWLAPRLERHDEEGWVRVLLKAADYLAWQTGRQFDELREEIEGYVHVHRVLGEDMARLDFLGELAKSWRELVKDGAGESRLLRVLPLTWTNAYENRHRILAECCRVAEKPEGALLWLDKVHSRAPLIAAHLGQSLGWLWTIQTDPRDNSALSTTIMYHLGGMNGPVGQADYALYRQHLLRMCVSEVIAPETVANLLSTGKNAFSAQLIYDDWPLRVVCLVHRLIYA
jgi:hypothetical protein